MRKTSRGAALVTVLFIMAALSISIGSLIPVTTSVSHYSITAEHRMRAKAYAGSGIQIAQSVIKEKSPRTFEQKLVIDEIEIKVIQANGYFKVISCGSSGKERYIITRKMK
ncbi:hypothetical protein ACFL6F_03955 [Planctomycetota bacterium]